MAGEVHVRRRKCTEGTAFYLDYAHNGQRHRPRLGVNLTKTEQSKLALEMVGRIHNGKDNGGCVPGQSRTFAQFLPVYWQAFAAKGRVDNVRPEGVINNHLLPRFGDKGLADINNPTVGMDYITARLKAGATAGTVQREWQVFMRIINLAVRLDVLDKNRLAPIKGDVLPEPTKRERAVERWELEALRDKGGDVDVWWMAVGGAHTGLRESKMILEATDVNRHKLEQDGYWAHLDKSTTGLKGNPELLPLNRWAKEALSRPVRWKTIHGFRESWATACEKAGIVDLHFHDLRHLFATTLEDLGVQDRHISLLLGHKLEGMTARYIRKNLRHLRDAVTRLELAFDPCNLSVNPVNLSPALSPKQVTYSTIGQVIEKQGERE